MCGWLCQQELAAELSLAVMVMNYIFCDRNNCHILIQGLKVCGGHDTLI